MAKIICKCKQKYRDEKGTITAYRLVDTSGNTSVFAPDELKTYIRKGVIFVDNLTLTKDNRLVTAKSKSLDSLSSTAIQTTTEEEFKKTWHKAKQYLKRKIIPLFDANTAENKADPYWRKDIHFYINSWTNSKMSIHINNQAMNNSIHGLCLRFNSQDIELSSNIGNGIKIITSTPFSEEKLFKLMDELYPTYKKILKEYTIQPLTKSECGYICFVWHLRLKTYFHQQLRSYVEVTRPTDTLIAINYYTVDNIVRTIRIDVTPKGAIIEDRGKGPLKKYTIALEKTRFTDNNSIYEKQIAEIIAKYIDIDKEES